MGTPCEKESLSTENTVEIVKQERRGVHRLFAQHHSFEYCLLLERRVPILLALVSAFHDLALPSETGSNPCPSFGFLVDPCLLLSSTAQSSAWSTLWSFVPTKYDASCMDGWFSSFGRGEKRHGSTA